MVTKVYFLSLAPNSNMYVIHEVIFQFILEKRLWIVFLVWSSMVDPNSSQHSTQHTFTTPTELWSKDLKCHWWSSRVFSFRFFLSFSLANKYLAITSVLTNVDFISDATWTMPSPLTLETSYGSNDWSKSSRGLRYWISASFAMHSRVCWEPTT